MKIFDSELLAFFKTKLEYVLARVYEKKYPELSSRLMFPVSSEGGEGVDSISYEVWDETGIAQFISAYAGDIPRADVKAQKFSVPIHRMAEAFGMSLDEIKKAQRTGSNLSDRKAKAVRNGHELKLNEVAFYGSDELGLMGLFSHPSIPNGNAPTLDWETGPKTPQEILDCFKAGLKAVKTATKNRERITAIRVPSQVYAHLALTQLNANVETTIFEWLTTKMKAVGVQTIEEYPEGDAVTMLGGTPQAAKQVVCYYDNSSECLELSVPEDIDFLDTQNEGLEQVTIGTMTTGGLIVFKPLAIFLQVISS